MDSSSGQAFTLPRRVLSILIGDESDAEEEFNSELYSFTFWTASFFTHLFISSSDVLDGVTAPASASRQRLTGRGSADVYKPLLLLSRVLCYQLNLPA